MAPTVLSVASRAVAEGCARLGIPIDELLAQADISPATLADPDARLDARQADLLWRLAYERSGDPCLSLHAAERVGFGAYRVVDHLVANSPSAGAGLERLARYFQIIDPRGRLEVRRGPPHRLVMTAGGGELPPPAQEYTLAVITSRVRAIGGDWPLEAVEFTFPPPADDREHRRVFGAPVLFGRSEAALVIGQRAWDMRFERAQAELLPLLEDYARIRLAEAPAGSALAARIGEAVREALREGRPQVGRVAKVLGMSPRTLQRNLAAEGTTFAAVVADVRFALARGYLAAGQISLAEIAFLLGFNDQAAFTRAFRRWSGVTPMQWRRRGGNRR
jgi:AraC-like DNA-binding protein